MTIPALLAMHAGLVQLSAYDRQARLAPRCRAMRVGSGATALDRIERQRAIPAKFDGLTLVID